MAKIDDSVKKKVPELRFKGFTDEWEERKLGDLATSFEYGLNASSKEFDGIHKYIRITDIDDSSRKFNHESLTSPDIDLSSADNYKLQDGDILFARTGASVGKTYIYSDSDGLVYYAGFLIRARIKSGVDSNFIFQHTLTSSYENFIQVTSQRSGQPGVNAKEYSIFEISVPSYEEQRRIGAFFKQLDNTIALHQRKLDLLKEQKKGYLQKMFPKSGEKIPELRFKSFTGDWEERKLSDIVVRLNKSSNNNQLPKVEFEDIIAGEGRLNKDISRKFDDRKGTLFEPDNILYGKLRPYLKNWLFSDFKGIALGDFWVFKSINSEPKFVYSLIQSDNYQRVANDTSGTKMPRSDWKKVSSSNFSIPTSLEEQQKIGSFFKQLDDTIALHQRKLDLLKEQKKGFLQKMFV